MRARKNANSSNANRAKPEEHEYTNDGMQMHFDEYPGSSRRRFNVSSYLRKKGIAIANVPAEVKVGPTNDSDERDARLPTSCEGLSD